MRALPLIVAAATLAPATAVHALEVVRAPYLQMMEPTATLVAFRTDDPCAGEVRYGATPDGLDTIVDGPTSTEHRIRLEGLTPDSTYHYAVWCNDLRLEPEHMGRFRTPPPVGTRQHVRAWIVGDSGTGGFPQMNVRDAAIAAWGRDAPDLFLHMGDMAYGDGTDLQFTLFFYGVYADVLRDVPVFPTMGNHEGHTSVADSQEGPYYEGYVLPRGGELGGVASGTEAYYSVEWANVHFIVLESHQSDRSPTGAMLTWLAEDLAAADADWIVAYWHHPPYTKGSHDSDTESNLIEMRENALPILEAGGVDLVLGGHSHTYERSFLVQGAYETPTTDAGIVDGSDGAPDGDGPYLLDPGLTPDDGSLYVVAGHGGAGPSQDGEHPLMIVSEPVHGSVIMDVHGDRLSLRNVRVDGVISDRVTLIKGAGIDVVAPDGGEELVAGAVSSILWGHAGLDGEGAISWSCDDGATWIDVGAAPLADGAFEWTVPQVATADGRLRLSSGAVSDVSDGRFSITGADLAPCPVPPPPPPDAPPDDDAGCGCGAQTTTALLPLLAVGGLRRRTRR